MTESAIAHTCLPDGAAAGQALGAQIAQGLNGQSPDALILFASPRYNYVDLLASLHMACRPRLLVGCSSSGEFSTTRNLDQSACAVALRSSELQFSAAIGRGLRTDRVRAAEELVRSFQGMATHDTRFRTALVLTDALAGYADDLVDQLTLRTDGTYQFFGGGAGDDARFEHTHVFYGTEAVSDAVVALEILSPKPLGIGVSHGWQPASAGMRVTEAEAMRVISFNATPALEVLQEHAERTDQQLNEADPLPFFLHNVVGIDTGAGYKLRVPLAVVGNGALSCAADVPTGVTACIMGTTSQSTAEAAASAASAALEGLQGNRPLVAFMFDCAATRLRLGAAFGLELRALEHALGSTPYIGCNTYGQIARAHGQFSGFHNCTAVVCLIPE
ncbi:MAG: hypothetical protein JWO42_1628 [Chloroflexi bacterium]|nr:hypothetical protein [Chloroflexota bacterium]